MDKQLWHQRWRAWERRSLASAAPQALGEHLTVLEHQVSNVWTMGKDGRTYWPVTNQVAVANRLAQEMGRNPQERESLKRRLMRKWMGKCSGLGDSDDHRCCTR